ncbi:DUF3221 domain-containing protein [Ureibacillus composti]|nr:DUF3221 domain-containing protein [Ureibacillus composti]
MNELKNSLIRAAGDLSESKETVRKRLYDRKKNPRQKTLFLARALSAIVTISILFIVANILMKDEELATASPFEESYYEVHYAITKSFDFSRDEELIQQNAYNQYEAKLAYYAYALSLGYEISDSDIKKMEQDLLAGNGMEKYDEYKEHLLQKANISEEDYIEYEKANAPFLVAQNMLEDHFMALFPKINDVLAKSLAQKHAIPYFQDAYAEDIMQFKETHGIVDNGYPGEGIPSVGRIVALEDNMFLVVEDATVEDIQTMDQAAIVKKYHQGVWYPQDETPELSVGDLVEVYSKTKLTTQYPFIADIWDFNMLEEYDENATTTEPVSLEVSPENESKLRVLLSMIRWEDKEVSMSRMPEYTLEFRGELYNLWTTPSHSNITIIPSSGGRYKSLSEERSKELAEILELE